MSKLSDLQKDKLQHLLNDDLLLKTIEQVFNETLDNNMPQVHLLDSNKRLGEKFRAYNEAKGIVRTAFLDLLSYKNEVVKENEVANRAR